MQIINFLKGIVLKFVPSLGYKGIVDTQIRMYKKLKMDNYKALQNWSKTTPPAVGLERLISNGGLRKNIDGKVINKFMNDNPGFIAPHQEQDILNIILDTRRRVSLKDVGANSYYQDLIAIPNKTLEETIWTIIDWELFSSMEAYKRRERNKIPLDFVDRYKQEILVYIRKKVSSI